jgi:hypothetical protein
VHHIRGRRYLRPGLPQLQHALLVCGVPAGNKCRFGHPVRQFRVDLDPDPAGVPIRVQGWVSRATPPHAVSNAGAARGIANPTVVSSAGSPATICDLTNGHSFRHDSHATRLDLNSRVRSPPLLNQVKSPDRPRRRRPAPGRSAGNVNTSAQSAR